jgi:hypothetical protein
MALHSDSSAATVLPLFEICCTKEGTNSRSPPEREEIDEPEPSGHGGRRLEARTTV